MLFGMKPKVKHESVHDSSRRYRNKRFRDGKSTGLQFVSILLKDRLITRAVIGLYYSLFTDCKNFSVDITLV